jgi:hypothetical protein
MIVRIPTRLILQVLVISTFVVTLVSGGTSSIKPEISIGLNADSSITSTGPLFGASLEPVVKWTTSGTIRNNIGYEVCRGTNHTILFFFFKRGV